MNGPAGLALAALALLAPVLVPGVSPALAQAPPPAALEAGCDPGIREALAASAARGVEQDLAVIRNPDQGIRDPDSILDFSCLEDFFNYRAFNVLFDPGRALEELLGLAQRRVCEIARNTYRGYVGRTLDASVYTSRVPRLPGLHRLPGLDTDARNGNVLQQQRGQRRTLPRHPGRWAMSIPVRCRTVFHAAVLATALTATLAVPPAHMPIRRAIRPITTGPKRAACSLVSPTKSTSWKPQSSKLCRLQTGQLSGYAAQSAKAVTGALDAQTKLQAQIAREVEETRAMRARRPTDSGCAAITGLAGLAAARQAAESAYVRAAGRGDGTYRWRPRRRARCRRRRGQRGPLREPDEHLLQRSARRGGCRALPGGGNAFHAADLKAGNLFDRHTFANEAELRTAVELSRNLAVARGPRPAGAGLRRDRSGAPPYPARPFGRRPCRSGRRLLRPCPRVACAGRFALGAWAALATPGRDAATPVSRYELLELLASRRFENPRLVRRSASDGPGEPAARVGHPASGLADARLAPLPARRTARRYRRHRTGAGRRRHAPSARPRQPGRRGRTDRHGRVPLLVRPGIDPLRSRMQRGLRPSWSGGCGRFGSRCRPMLHRTRRMGQGKRTGCG